MKFYSTLLVLMITGGYLHAQVAINASGSPAHPNAMLDISSSSKGLLPPRMTNEERDAITGEIPAGLTIFNTSTNCTNVFNGVSWYELCGNCLPGIPAQPSGISGSDQPCSGETGVTYSVDSENGVSYTWQFPDGWVQTAGGNTASVTVTPSSSDGWIMVTPSNACGVGDPQGMYVYPGDVPEVPNAFSATVITGVQFTAQWDWSLWATGFRIDVSTDAGFGSFVGAYNDYDAGGSTSLTITGLTPNTTYYYRVRGYSQCGNSASSSPVMVSTNNCAPATITHQPSDNISPVNSTITYGTTNFTGLCWITRNLGATTMASSSTDNTDAAAGWYWKFNRKKGYDIPLTTGWNVTTINENSNWTLSEDPCRLLLGGSWRIPTSTEWETARQAFSSNSLSGSFNSPLKLHGAGALLPEAGNVWGRQTNGEHWSSTQYNNVGAWALRMSTSHGYTYDQQDKDLGGSVRCVSGL